MMEIGEGGCYATQTNQLGSFRVYIKNMDTKHNKNVLTQ